MNATTDARIRRSLQDILNDYTSGVDTTTLDTLVRAWRGIQNLPPDDPNSFFVIGGYHGEPFRGPGMMDTNWWGGFCQHGTVLFPIWHRAYLHRLEGALRSVPGCKDVALPFWDECSEESRTTGVPWIFTQPTFDLDGEVVGNPLFSFVLPEGIVDRLQNPTPSYSKPAGYRTVRYPLSGLVGTPADIAATDAQNAPYLADPASATHALNENVQNWLKGSEVIPGQSSAPAIYDKFVACLDSPTYTLFSNVTSATAHNDIHGTNLTPLEDPHNDMHLAVGGFDYPGAPQPNDFSPISGANGDMGENDTAGLDPIFFFHHCFIDYVFWTWQRRHAATDAFTIDPTDPGSAYWANAASGNQPPAGANYGSVLGLDTPLNPFPNADDTGIVTPAGCVNIETQLGYSYGPGSLDAHIEPSATGAVAPSLRPAPTGRTVRVSGINRSKIRGSFLVSAFARVNGERMHIGTTSILSRWHLEGCMNCQTRLEAKVHFRLPDAADDVQARMGGVQRALAAPALVEVEVRTHEGLFGNGPQRPAHLSLRGPVTGPAPYTVEIR